MPTITVSTTIDRPAPVVWAVVADYERDPEWREGVETMAPSPSGPVDVGTTTAEVLHFGGRIYCSAGEVTQVEPGTAFRWRTTSGADADGRRRVQPSADGSASVTIELTDPPPRSGARTCSRCSCGCCGAAWCKTSSASPPWSSKRRSARIDQDVGERPCCAALHARVGGRRRQPPETRSSAPSGGVGSSAPSSQPSGRTTAPRAVGVAAGGPESVLLDLGLRIELGEEAVEVGEGSDDVRLLPRGSAHRIAGEVPAGVLAERLHAADLAAPLHQALRRGPA